jgi:uncharacterized phage protein (TIGR01671 family)
MNRFKFRVWDTVLKKMCEWSFVIPFKNTEYVIQQSTGFADKNDVEIYEGDILAVRPISNKELVTIVWDKSRFTMLDKYGCDILEVPYGTIPMDEEEMSAYRVVGNIFENQDLVK